VGGQQQDFERLVALYERRLFNVALRLTNSTDDAAELVQETYLRAFRSWAKFRKEAQAYTWLYRILINLNKDRLARAGRLREREAPLGLTLDGEEGFEFPDDAPSPDRIAENAELRRTLQAAIDSLPLGYRECVVLRDVDGLSYGEIAATMGITVEAVRSRLARARQQLRQRLAPYIRT
jgi:RNA polymerase sigma-70 factor (ECF subfamily)